MASAPGRMNYRHHFHAGNFADITKHVVVFLLFREMQKKDKGILYLDTHAGRGSYDLTEANHGDSRIRAPEWPDGIGRLWKRDDLVPALEKYVELARRFDFERGNREAMPRFFPGSPQIAALLARPQDRLVLCEKHPDEYQQLAEEFRFLPGCDVRQMDGFESVRAVLPPKERRALILIDPPYEETDELTRALTALRSGLERLPGGVFALWFPLTQRVQMDVFFREWLGLRAPPTVVIELTIGGESEAGKLRGSGLVVFNPPWQFENTAEPILRQLRLVLAQSPSASGAFKWLIPEA
jgi:23S rRNA (adenine2030-N6)-methyltransferase